MRPFVSIIIPVFNNSTGVKDTLLSLFALNYFQDRFEIIVIDNNSTDDTYNTIIETACTFNGNIRVEKETQPGSYAARNKGILISKGEILAFIDADMTVQPDWLQKGIEKLETDNAGYLGCDIKTVPANDPPTPYERYQKALGFPVKQYMAVNGYAPTACLFVRKKVIEKAGPFDVRLQSGGDVEFGNRVRDLGFKMVYDPDNIMIHPARKTFPELLNKQKRVTLGQIELRRLYPERFNKNRTKDIVTLVLQFLPIADPSVLKKLFGDKKHFIPLFGLFYVLRLYTNWLKLINRCIY